MFETIHSWKAEQIQIQEERRAAQSIHLHTYYSTHTCMDTNIYEEYEMSLRENNWEGHIVVQVNCKSVSQLGINSVLIFLIWIHFTEDAGMQCNCEVPGLNHSLSHQLWCKNSIQFNLFCFVLDLKDSIKRFTFLQTDTHSVWTKESEFKTSL